MAKNVGLEIFEYLLEYGVVFVVIYCIYKIKLTKVRWRWVVAGLCFVLSLLGAEILYKDMDMLIFFLAQLLIVIFIFDVEWRKKVALYFFCFIYPSFLTSYIQLIMVWIFHTKYEQAIENDKYSMMGYIPVYITIIIIGILCNNIKPFKQLRKMPDKYLWILNISGLFCAIAISALCGIVDMFSGFTRNFLTFAIITSSLMVLVLVAGFVVADILRKKYENEIKMKDRYAELIKKHYKLLLDKDEETRKIRHDIRTHMMMLNEYANKNNFELLKQYLREMNDNYQIISQYIYTGNRIVDAVIANMENKLKDCNINVKVNGKLPQSIHISDYDLCTVVSNLLLNAIEASEKLLTLDKEVIITVKYLQYCIVIEVENHIEQQIDTQRIVGYTNKKDKNVHGYGLINVQETVEKYNGDLKIECEDNLFRVKVMFSTVRT